MKYIGVIFILTLIPTNTARNQGDLQSEMLRTHNGIRRIYGTGDMTLSRDLNARSRQCARYYARISAINHTCPHKNRSGENLASISYSGSPNYINAVKLSSKLFYNERRTYNYDDPAKSRGVTGHFTQMVWRASTRLGVGVSKNRRTRIVYVVALYRAPGNILSRTEGKRYKYFKENVPSPR